MCEFGSSFLPVTDLWDSSLSVRSAVKPTVCDNGDGTYHVSYSPEEPGLYAVCVCVKGQHVQVAFLFFFLFFIGSSLHSFFLSKYLLKIFLRIAAIAWQLKLIILICDRQDHPVVFLQMQTHHLILSSACLSSAGLAIHPDGEKQVPQAPRSVPLLHILLEWRAESCSLRLWGDHAR